MQDFVAREFFLWKWFFIYYGMYDVIIFHIEKF